MYWRWLRADRPAARVAGPALLALALGLLAFLTLRGTARVDTWMPHGYCFTWQPALVATHVVSDALIGLAYLSIPITLVAIVRRRGDVPFDGVAFLFALFIVTCGLTHFVAIWTIWNPDYRLAGAVKVLSAAASVLTAIVLVRLAPAMLRIPTAARMAATLAALEREVAARRDAEQALRDERDALERRVAERTGELEAAHAEADAARTRAEQANAAKDRFLASVSHELRTPLQAMLGWSEVLAASPGLPAEARRGVERIQANVAAQARLVDDLLDLSRILSGKLSLEAGVVDGAAAVEQAVDGVRHCAAAQGVEIAVGRVDSAFVETDPIRLRQVLWNLLTNAVNASAPGQRVAISARHLPAGADPAGEPERVAFEVADDGVGFGADEAESLFEPFRQGRGRGGGGLGLGLAISRSLVQRMGGTLSGSSAGPGLGARFVVVLPVRAASVAAGLAAGGAHAPAAEPPPPDAPGAALLARLAGRRLLYVEDDADIREPTARRLADFGLAVTATGDAAEAARWLAERDFDALVSDLRLADGADGRELARQLRARGGRAVAIAVSAWGQAEDVQASLAAGFDLHLPKPLDAARLAQRLAERLGPPSN